MKSGRKICVVAHAGESDACGGEMDQSFLVE